MKKLSQNAFGAMLWKEARENAVWAALGALALVVINYKLFLDLTGSTIFGNYYDSGPLYRWIEWGSEPVYTIGVAPLLAVVLGFMQVIPELRRDQWAFLVHRPLTFATLFRYKATAGLLLYFLSMGGMFLLLWALRWLTITRSTPELPFDGRFMLGGVADILVGVPCYFAGMLCAVRVTRWYGSRFIPLVGCGLLCFYSYGFHEFYQVVAAVFVCSFIVGLAAKSSFVAQGQYGPQKKIGRLALGLSLLPGLLTLGVIAVLLYEVWYRTYLSTGREWGDTYLGRRQYLVLPNGELGQEISKLGQAETRYEDLNGRKKKVTYEEVRYFEPGIEDDSWKSYRSAGRYIINYDYYSDVEALPANFSLYSQKKRLFLLYSHNWNFIGYVTPIGFYPKGTPLPRNAGFQGNLIARMGDRQLWFSDGIYRFEQDQKAIKRIVSNDNIEAVAWHGVMKQLPRPSEYDPATPYIARQLVNQSLTFVTSATVEFLDRNKQLLFRVQREHDPHLYSNISTQMNRAGNRFFILYQPGLEVPEMERRELPLFLVAYDEKGQVLARHQLPPLPPQRDYIAVEVKALGSVVPLTALAGYLAYAWSGVAAYGVPPELWLEQLRFHFPEIVGVSILAFCATVVSCLLLWLIRRRSGLTRRSFMIWQIAVFLLGPVGLLLFLAMRGWPPRVSCPNCSKLRAVNFNNCEHCGTPWPVRPKDSADIFPAAPNAKS